MGACTAYVFIFKCKTEGSSSSGTRVGSLFRTSYLLCIFWESCANLVSFVIMPSFTSICYAFSDESWIKNVNINLPAVKRRAETVTARRGVKKQWQVSAFDSGFLFTVNGVGCDFGCQIL